MTPLSTPADPIPPPAWQQGNPRLAAKWTKITGRYIYHQACTPCHEWGPEYWLRDRWRQYLLEFPENHEPDVGETYEDLTAMFGVEAQVPTEEQRLNALGEFILADAPLAEPTQMERQRLPRIPNVGEKAPDFSIVDVQGRTFALSQLKNERSLILIFSRAHW